MNDSTHTGGRGSAFPSTSWSLIRAIQGEPTGGAREGLERLFSIYWKPVYGYIRASWRKGNEDAKDLTQGFFALLLEGDSFGCLAEEHGTFRSYLRAALSHYLVSQDRRDRSLKRGSAQHRIPMDLSELNDELSDPSAASPEEAFDREWISSTLTQAMSDLEILLRAEHRDLSYQILKFYYLDSRKSAEAAGPIAQKVMEPDEEITYDRVAEKFGIKNHEVRSHLAYARNKLKELLEQRARDHSDSDRDAESEFRFLIGE